MSNDQGEQPAVRKGSSPDVELDTTINSDKKNLSVEAKIQVSRNETEVEPQAEAMTSVQKS